MKDGLLFRWYIQTLTVSNAPRWIYKVKTEDTDKQFDLLISDFEAVRKNAGWKRLIEGKAVVFNLYSDESLTGEIAKTGKKRYD